MRSRISCTILALAAATTALPAQSPACDSRASAEAGYARLGDDVALGSSTSRGGFVGLPLSVGIANHAPSCLPFGRLHAALSVSRPADFFPLALTGGAAVDEPQDRNPYALRRALSGWGLVGTYALTVLAAGAMGDSFFGLTATPVVGPWLTIVTIQGSGGKYSFQSGAMPLLVISGLAQGALLASWLDARAKARRWDQRVLVLPTGSGVGVVGTIGF